MPSPAGAARPPCPPGPRYRPRSSGEPTQARISPLALSSTTAAACRPPRAASRSTVWRDLALQLLLQAEVERRAPGAGGRCAVPLAPAHHPRGEMRREERRSAGRREQRLGPRRDPPPRWSRSPRRPGRTSACARRRFGAAAGDQRIVARRRPRQPGEQRRLAEAQRPRRGREVQRRAGLDTRCALSQRHAVEVLLQDRLLVEVPLQAERPRDLTGLAGPGPRRGAEHPGELHRDGRAAGDDRRRRARLAQAARATARGSTPAVAVEAAILRGEERRDQIGIDLGQRHPPAPAAVLGARRAQLAAVAVEQHEPGVRLP